MNCRPVAGILGLISNILILWSLVSPRWSTSLPITTSGQPIRIGFLFFSVFYFQFNQGSTATWERQGPLEICSYWSEPIQKYQKFGFRHVTIQEIFKTFVSGSECRTILARFLVRPVLDHSIFGPGPGWTDFGPWIPVENSKPSKVSQLIVVCGNSVMVKVALRATSTPNVTNILRESQN